MFVLFALHYKRELYNFVNHKLHSLANERRQEDDPCGQNVVFLRRLFTGAIGCEARDERGT